MLNLFLHFKTHLSPLPQDGKAPGSRGCLAQHQLGTQRIPGSWKGELQHSSCHQRPRNPCMEREVLGDRGFHHHQRKSLSFGFKFSISVGAEQLSALSHSIHTLLQQSPWGRGSKCHLNELVSASFPDICAGQGQHSSVPCTHPRAVPRHRALGVPWRPGQGRGLAAGPRMGSSAQRVPLPSCPVPRLVLAAPPCPPSAFHHLYYTLQPN